jgi:signal transduction histidine kinase
MSAELAQWLTDHQHLLLSRWTSAIHPLVPANGHTADGVAGGVVLEDIPGIEHHLEQLYDGLVLAAQGNSSSLDQQLQMLSRGDGIHLASLPYVMTITQQLRRLAWELLRHEQNDPAHLFALTDNLETLLEYMVTHYSQTWQHMAETSIKASKDEADFIAQSMNSTIEQADHTAVQLSLLNDVAQRLSSSLESAQSTDIIAMVGDKLTEILEVGHLSIWLPDEEKQRETSEVVLYAVHNWNQDQQPITGMRLQLALEENWPDDIILQCYMHSQPMFAFDSLPNPVHQGHWYQSGCGVAALPLLVQDRAIGVVVLQDPHLASTFTAAQQDTLSGVISQAAIALDNARLYARVRRFNVELEQQVEQRTSELQTERDRLSTLHDIALEVSSSLDLDQLLTTSLEALARITQVKFGSIMLIDPETEHLINRAMLGQDVVNSFTRFRLGHGVAGWVAQHKKPTLVPDITSDERWEPHPTGEQSSNKRTGSMVSVPLIVHDQCLGVLTLSHEQPNYFNQDHLRLLMASAGTISIGIHNANLYADIVSEMEHRSELLQKQQIETTQIGAILQSLSDGVAVCDLDGFVLTVNQACSTILQRPVEDLLLMTSLHDVMHNLLGKRINELPLNELLNRPTGANGQPRIFESTVELGMRVIHLRLGPVLKDNGELIGALLMLRDKTREVESDRLKTEFIGTMSHELRTPMTSIKGFTQLLVMGSLGPVNDTQREFLNTIQTNSERMISIINDVLELTKIETGSIELEIRPLHLAEVLSDVMTEVEVMKTNRNHELDVQIPPGLPLVKADASRLHQILYNLLCNAIKYTPEGGQIAVAAHEASFDALPQHVRDCIIGERRYLQINVSDNGVGISEHELDSIFERFYRTENPLKVEAGGTGLGLSLTRPLIQLLEGHIWVVSQIGQGSTFSFILPIAAS